MYMNVEVAALHVMKSQMLHGIMITYIRECRDLMDINTLEGVRVAIRAVTGFPQGPCKNVFADEQLSFHRGSTPPLTNGLISINNFCETPD